MFRNTGANAFAKNQTRLAYEDKRDLYCMYFPWTSATPGELCTMDVSFRPDVDIPRTSSNPGEESAVQPGYGSVLGFSQVDSAQIRGQTWNAYHVKGRTVPRTLVLRDVVSVHIRPVRPEGPVCY